MLQTSAWWAIWLECRLFLWHILQYNFYFFSKHVNSLAVSMDGTLLLSGSEDQSARVWHVHSRQCLRVVNHKGTLVRWTPSHFLSSVHATPEKFKHASLFLRLGLSCTLNCHENGTVLKLSALQTGGSWKRRLFVFMWAENILKTELFENDGMFLKHTSKMSGDFCVFKFLPSRRSVDGAWGWVSDSEQTLNLEATENLRCKLIYKWPLVKVKGINLARLPCTHVFLRLIYYFSNLLIIHQVKAKKITTVKEVWIPGPN